MPYIGKLPLDRVHNDALVIFKQDRRSAGRMAGTINKELEVFRRILNLAAQVWRHPSGQTWLPAPPLLDVEKGPARRPYPISWKEQGRLFRDLPAHLERIALFTYHGNRLSRVRNHAWKKARDRTGLPEVRVHDLRHTFGYRLRAAGVSFEDRQDLLGHKAMRITTHYSSPDLIRLLDAANLLCEKRPATVLRVAAGGIRKKLPQNFRKAVP